MPVIEGRLHPSDEVAFDQYVDENREDLLKIAGPTLGPLLVIDPSVRNVRYMMSGKPGSYVIVRAGGPETTIDEMLCGIGDVFVSRFDVEVHLSSCSRTEFLPKGSETSFLYRL